MATPEILQASNLRVGRALPRLTGDVPAWQACAAGRVRPRRQRTRRGVARAIVGLLAIAGLSAVTRSTTDFRASPGAVDSPNRAAVEARSIGTSEAPQRTTARPRGRFRPHCPECGIVESIRPYGLVEGNLDGDGVAQVDAGSGYEVTIRHRDGSVTLLDEPTARSWRTGSRITLIAGDERPAP